MAKQQTKKFRKNHSAPKKSLNWLWGLPSVIETLQIGRWRVYELYVNTDAAESNSALIQAKKVDGVELHVVSNAKLEELSQSKDHQGIVARVSKYPYLSLDEIQQPTLIGSESNGPLDASPLWVVIDRIQDAFQFASILRCCHSASVSGMIVGEYCQAQVTPQIARASLGAVNHFPIVQTADLSLAILKLKGLGVSIAAYHAEAKQSIANLSNANITALLIGNDSQGIDPNLLSQCDYQCSIPIHGKVTLLPATVAAGILLYELRRHPEPTPLC